MADTRQRTTLGTRLRLFVRLSGLTGALLVAAGAVLGSVSLPTNQPFFSSLIPAAQGTQGTNAQIASVLLLAGGTIVAVWLLVEAISAFSQITGRKSTASLNLVLQTALAAGLLFVVNGLSLTNYLRWDATRDHRFTLPKELIEKLKKIDPSKPTDIIVYRTSQDSADDGTDALDAAADRKVVEKVNDLVDLFREFGPQFRVLTLSRKDEGFEDRLDELTRKNEPLKAAIEAAPGNSIFFHANKRVERLGFSEFYLLDKTASRETLKNKDGKDRKRTTNLVLIPQGIDRFADKVLAVGRPKPRIGLATIHPFLSTGGTKKESLKIDQYTAAGLRKSLERNGFDVLDLVLKKNWFSENPVAPGADTYEDFEFEDVETDYAAKEEEILTTESALREIETVRKATEKLIDGADAAKTPEEKLKLLQEAAVNLQQFTPNRIQSERQVRAVFGALPQLLEEVKQVNTDAKAKLTELRPKYLELLKDERLQENRRQSDVKAKLKKYVADCDMLIVPRLTTVELSGRNVIPPDLFQLNKDQAEVIREFLKANKPVLFAFGPTNVARDQGPMLPAKDEVEELIARFGIDLGTQTIVTDVEKDVMARQRNGGLGETADVPPLVLAENTKEGQGNPIAVALRTMARTGDKQFEIKRSGYRPVFLVPGLAEKLPYAAEIAYTVKESWNEDRPVPGRGYVPKYEPNKPNDLKNGTREQEHRGPFPVGVAVEVPIPADWLETKDAAIPAAILAGGLAPLGPNWGAIAEAGFLVDPHSPLLPEEARKNLPATRLVVLGHGGLFTGLALNAGAEALLLNAVNWQLRQDDRMPTDLPDDQKWKYPRANLSSAEQTAWHWGAFLGMPALAVYCGLIVLQLRRLR